MDMPSGVVSHAQLQGVTINQHHNKLHAAAHLFGGGDTVAAAIRQELRARKTADQSVTNSLTLVDDPDLQIAVTAGQLYGFELHLEITGPAVGGFSYKVLLPSGGSCRLHAVHQGGSGYLNAGTIQNMNQQVTLTSADSDQWIHIFGVLTPTASENLKMQYAQGTANVTATVFKLNSIMAVWPWS